MPGGRSGTTVTRILRADPMTYGCPHIVAISHEGLASECIDAGANQFLAKPIGFPAIRRLIEHVAKRARGGHGSRHEAE
jgi:CheY-like chemotaxis protein